MTPELQAKIAKIYELVKRGTDGEQAAAKKALDNILAKHDLEDIDLENIDKLLSSYPYNTELEARLLIRIIKILSDDPEAAKQCTIYTYAPKHLRVHLRYMDSVTVACAYEYFRRHMKVQWNKLCKPELEKCRKAKTRNARREELKSLFFNKYIMACGLYTEDELTEVDFNKLSQKEQRDRLKMEEVEGGKYNRQMNTGHLLEN